MAKRNKKRRTKVEHSAEPKKSIDKKGFLRLGILVAVTAGLFVLYRYLMEQPYVRIALTVYLVVATTALLTYVIYNRGFSRRGITEEMLPDAWSEEKKREFLEDGQRRLCRSRPLLIVVAALFFVLLFDAVELFVFPFLKSLVGLS